MQVIVECFRSLAARASPSEATGPSKRPDPVIFTLAGLCCIVLALGDAAAQEPVRLRVLSYNIHHAEGTDRQVDVPRIARVITAVQPDLVALQEVDQRVARSKMVDQPAELARSTELQVVFGDNIELQAGRYGNAVLSRFPITAHRNHRLPRFDESEQRGVLEVELRLPGTASTLRVFATHLDHRPADRERLASARFIEALAAQHPQQPALLVGDLNDTPDSATLRRFLTTWTQANPQPLATIPVDEPARQIDYILMRPASRWRVLEVRVLEEAVASDHRAIFAVLELLPE